MRVTGSFVVGHVLLSCMSSPPHLILEMFYLVLKRFFSLKPFLNNTFFGSGIQLVFVNHLQGFLACLNIFLPFLFLVAYTVLISRCLGFRFLRFMEDECCDVFFCFAWVRFCLFAVHLNILGAVIGLSMRTLYSSLKEFCCLWKVSTVFSHTLTIK